MVAIEQDIIIQPGGIIRLHSDQFPPGARAHVTVVVDSPSDSASISPSYAPRIPGLWKGKISIADDFDAELPQTFWLGDE